jgi:hypothetical protein
LAYFDHFSAISPVYWPPYQIGAICCKEKKSLLFFLDWQFSKSEVACLETFWQALAVQHTQPVRLKNFNSGRWKILSQVLSVDIIS